MKHLSNLFSKRLNRINFWAGLSILLFVFPFVLSVLNEFDLFSSPTLEWIPLIFLILMSLSITIRRLHDINRSGWYLLYLFVPILNFLIPIWLVSARGTEGKNRYGDENKGFSIKSVFGLS